MTDTLQCSQIRVGQRYRRDMGDLQSLADSIAHVGLLQPVGVTADKTLVYGARRLYACWDILGWDEIPARVVNVEDIVQGEYDENAVRKDFTVSERVAIAQTIEARIGNRQGQRTGLRHRGDEVKETGHDKPHLPACNSGRTDDLAARRAGFESRRSYRDARSAVEQGAPELVAAMDAGKVSVTAAGQLAALSADEQRAALAQGGLPARRKAKAVRKGGSDRNRKTTPGLDCGSCASRLDPQRQRDALEAILHVCKECPVTEEGCRAVLERVAAIAQKALGGRETEGGDGE